MVIATSRQEPASAALTRHWMEVGGRFGRRGRLSDPIQRSVFSILAPGDPAIFVYLNILTASWTASIRRGPFSALFRLRNKA